MVSTKKHSMALVHPGARLGDGCEVAAFAVIEDGVVLGNDCKVAEGAILRSGSTLGDGVQVHAHAVIGGPPQHLKYQGEPTTVSIGDGVVVRESCTVNRGTPFGIGTTIVGNRTFLMAYTHVAHDCVIGEDCILANSVHLAGHVELGKSVGIGGMTGVTQFVRVGDHCFIGGTSMLRKDLPPFLVGKGNDFRVQGINLVGLRRKGFSKETLTQLRKMYRIFYMRGLTISQGMEKILTEIGESEEINHFLGFLEGSKTGIQH